MDAYGYIKRWGNPETVEKMAWRYLQKLAITNFCNSHHLNLVQFFEEDQPEKLRERPALSQMLEALKKKEADCAVVCGECASKKDARAYDVTVQVRFCGYTTCMAKDIGRLCVEGEILNPELCAYR